MPDLLRYVTASIDGALTFTQPIGRRDWVANEKYYFLNSVPFSLYFLQLFLQLMKVYLWVKFFRYLVFFSVN